MTPKRGAEPAPAPEPEALEGLTATLADVVCWFVFYLERCTPDELDLDVAQSLLNLATDALRTLSVPERLTFLEHASARAQESKVPEYQDFLLDLAETLGLE
ncbi:MAG: hypothetical protein ACYDH6_17355 [Acidimicrobiales bacterium]